MSLRSIAQKVKKMCGNKIMKTSSLSGYCHILFVASSSVCTHDVILLIASTKKLKEFSRSLSRSKIFLIRLIKLFFFIRIPVKSTCNCTSWAVVHELPQKHCAVNDKRETQCFDDFLYNIYIYIRYYNI